MTFDTLSYEIKAGAEIFVSGVHIVHMCPQLKPLKHNKLSYSLFQKSYPVPTLHESCTFTARPAAKYRS